MMIPEVRQPLARDGRFPPSQFLPPPRQFSIPLPMGNKVYAAQEKDAPRSTAGDQSASLNDQTDLNVTVYNSNIALIRDVRNLTLPAGASDSNSWISRDRQPRHCPFSLPDDPEKLGVIEQNYEIRPS